MVSDESTQIGIIKLIALSKDTRKFSLFFYVEQRLHIFQRLTYESNFPIIGQFRFSLEYQDFLCSFRKQRTKEVDMIRKATERMTKINKLIIES